MTAKPEEGHARRDEEPPTEANPKDRLTDRRILADADAFHEAHGRWPNRDDGPVETSPGETWGGYDQALHKGHRGLQPGRTLRGLLAEERDFHDTRRRPLTLALIRARGAEYKAENGLWPDRDSGQVAGEPQGETWLRWEGAVQQGLRGLPRRPSLAHVFAHGDADDANRSIERRRPWRTLEKVKILLEEFHGRTGGWPTETTEDRTLEESAGETWRRLNKWLLEEHGTTLVALARELGARNKNRPGPLDLSRLRREALKYKIRHDAWPTRSSGPVDGWDGEVWENLHKVLSTGRRGVLDRLPRRMTLREFIEVYCVEGRSLP